MYNAQEAYDKMLNITISEVQIKNTTYTTSLLVKWLLPKLRNQCDWGCVKNGGLNGLLLGMYIGASSVEYLQEVFH